MVSVSDEFGPEEATVWFRCSVCLGYWCSVQALKNHASEAHEGKTLVLPRNIQSGVEDGKIYTTYDSPYHGGTGPAPFPLGAEESANGEVTQERESSDRNRSSAPDIARIPDSRHDEDLPNYDVALSSGGVGYVEPCDVDIEPPPSILSFDSGIQMNGEGSRNVEECLSTIDEGVVAASGLAVNEESVSETVAAASEPRKDGSLNSNTDKFQCETCNKRFRNKASLGFHLKKFCSVAHKTSLDNAPSTVRNTDKVVLTISRDEAGNLSSTSGSGEGNQPNEGNQSPETLRPPSPSPSDVGSQAATVFLPARPQGNRRVTAPARKSAPTTMVPEDDALSRASSSSGSKRGRKVTQNKSPTRKLPLRGINTVPSAPSSHLSESSEDWDATAAPKKKALRLNDSSASESESKNSDLPMNPPKRPFVRKSRQNESSDSSDIPLRKTRSSMRLQETRKKGEEDDDSESQMSSRSSRTDTSLSPVKKSRTTKKTKQIIQSDSASSGSSGSESDDLFEEVIVKKRKGGKKGSTSSQSSVFSKLPPQDTSASSENKIVCKFCPHKVKDSSTLAQHIGEVHPHEEMSWSCGNCLKKIYCVFDVFNTHMKECCKLKKATT